MSFILAGYDQIIIVLIVQAIAKLINKLCRYPKHLHPLFILKCMTTL